MPEDKIVFTDDVMRMTRFAKQTIGRFVREGKFPKPSKIGNRNAWFEEDILNWINEQMKEQQE